MRWTWRHKKPKSLWYNRIILPGINVIDHTKFDSDDELLALPESISLRGRDLRGAVFIQSKLRKADFTAAKLQGAKFDEANIRDAKFECGEQGANNRVRLQGAVFFQAQLRGPRFVGLV